jgi:hypothetical protein
VKEIRPQKRQTFWTLDHNMPPRWSHDDVWVCDATVYALSKHESAQNLMLVGDNSFYLLGHGGNPIGIRDRARPAMGTPC